MAKVALIMGDSGSGKTNSIKYLNPKETFIVNPSCEQLAIPKGSEKYIDVRIDPKKGNLLNEDRASKIAKALVYIDKQRPEIKTIIIDDNQFITLMHFKRKAHEKSFDKFTDMAVNMVDLVQICKSLRPDLTIFFMNHIEIGVSARGEHQIQAKVISKFVKEKFIYEGLFPQVLLVDKEPTDSGVPHHFFWTQLADSTVKTPEGMFEDIKIPNNLQIVKDAMDAFY